jgi:indole-3-glycerol phosphate synthase
VAAARDAELFVLLEAFDREDLDRIGDRELDPGVLVGVNSRDLDTLEVRRSAHADLFEHVPEGCVAIAESGIETPEQVRELREIGYEGVLVGTSLMRSADPGSAVAAMVAAGEGDDE